MLGRVVEVASGMNFRQFLKQRLWGPLGMTDTDFGVSQGNVGRALPRPDGSVQRAEDTTYFSGAAGMVSSVPDYAKFVVMLVDGGRANGHQFLRPQTLRAMTSNQIGWLAMGGYPPMALPPEGVRFGYGVVEISNPDAAGTHLPKGSFGVGRGGHATLVGGAGCACGDRQHGASDRAGGGAAAARGGGDRDGRGGGRQVEAGGLLPSLRPARYGRIMTHPATQLVHAGTQRSQFAETGEAVFLSSGFVYDSAEQAEATFLGEVAHYQYTRFGNPNLAMLEARLAAIEGAEACRVTASGMAAVHGALLAHLSAGDHVVAARALFGSCHWIVSTLLPRYGISATFVDGTDLAAWRAALMQPTRLVLVESPSNPMLDILDLAAIAALAHAAGAIVVVDNVFATPLGQKPLELGADVVVYSCTKHIDGSGRVLGGAVLGRRAWIEDTLQPFLRNTGPALSPFNAWVLLKGLETLGLRLAAASASAESLAGFLAGHAAVLRVWYPTRADHPGQALTLRQMRSGGTIVSFEVAGGRGRRVRIHECTAARGDFQQSGRQQIDGDASGHHDAYAHRGRGAGAARHHRRGGAAVGGDRGCAGFAGRSGRSAQWHRRATGGGIADGSLCGGDAGHRGAGAAVLSGRPVRAR